MEVNEEDWTAINTNTEKENMGITKKRQRGSWDKYLP